MYLVTIMSQCSDPALIHILGLMKSALKMIQLVGPIVGIISIVLNLIKLMTNPDEKKNKQLIINWAIAVVMLFLLPTIVNLTMSLLDDSFKISSCWNSAMVVIGSFK